MKDELSVFEGVILRIVVPQLLRKQNSNICARDSSRKRKDKQFLKKRFFWPGMDDAVAEKRDKKKLLSLRGESAFK